MDLQTYMQLSANKKSGMDEHESISDIGQMEFRTIKPAGDASKDKIKQFSQADLLKLLSYLEGELQARDVVIAALKSEKLKKVIHLTRGKPIGPTDPYASLFRDHLVCKGNYVSRQSSTAAIQCENEMQQFASNQLDLLEVAINQQRNAHFKLLKILRESENKHNGLMRELEDARQKHERDTAQGDDITFGLEIERSRLRQELEAEVVNRQKIEKDLKKAQEQLEQERARQKQIVLMLLAERKKIITKYIEERKRSEDLAQILSEEKQRVDTIAEGLEEESKKSLRMEAELEKQMQTFINEKKLLKKNLAKEEKRIKDCEAEIVQLKAENELLKKQSVNHRLGPKHIAMPHVPGKIGNIRDNTGLDTQDDIYALSSAGANATPTSANQVIGCVSKIVQPTATVSSVPVSAPTTGVARCIPISQTVRMQPVHLDATLPTETGPMQTSSVNKALIIEGSTISATPNISANSECEPEQSSTQISSEPQYGNVPVANPQITAAAVVNNVKRKPSDTSNTQDRGAPPPVPPNKPVVPKRESSATRLLATGAVTTAVAMINNNNNNNNSNNSNSNNATATTTTTTASVKNVSISPQTSISGGRDATNSSIINKSQKNVNENYTAPLNERH